MQKTSSIEVVTYLFQHTTANNISRIPTKFNVQTGIHVTTSTGQLSLKVSVYFECEYMGIDKAIPSINARKRRKHESEQINGAKTG
jgi:hypothetical protein